MDRTDFKYMIVASHIMACNKNHSNISATENLNINDIAQICSYHPACYRNFTGITKVERATKFQKCEAMPRHAHCCHTQSFHATENAVFLNFQNWVKKCTKTSFKTT